jgi:protease YdgD
VRFLLLLASMWTANPAYAQDSGRLPDAPRQNLPPASKPTEKFPKSSTAEIGSITPRNSVDQNEMPWRMIGRVRAGGISCTGALIGPALVLTAAHCVFNPETRRLFPAQAIHFMLGYSQGRYVADAYGIGLTLSDDYDPAEPMKTVGHDWALLVLGHSIGTSGNTLLLREQPPPIGARVSLGGYAVERPEVLMVDSDCRVVGTASDQTGTVLIQHDCIATHGVSGAPLLLQEGVGWVISGIEVIGTPDNGGGATRLDGVLAAVREMNLR